jgi:hypothetical protein
LLGCLHIKKRIFENEKKTSVFPYGINKKSHVPLFLQLSYGHKIAVKSNISVIRAALFFLTTKSFGLDILRLYYFLMNKIRPALNKQYFLLIKVIL